VLLEELPLLLMIIMMHTVCLPATFLCTYLQAGAAGGLPADCQA
jgi:hypothetical protein